jgi:hypothetical protein
MTRRSNVTLPEDYLRWLEPQLRDEHGNPDKTYWDLLNVMWEREFGWVMEMDQNRMQDGLDLRVEFAREHRIHPDAMDPLGPCTFLEVLIGLSRRLAFIAGGQAPGWAWQLLGNLEFHRMSDPISQPKHRRIEEIMTSVIERRYLPDGTGGFFPLAWPDDDQTKIELWYQLNAYVGELHPEH